MNNIENRTTFYTEKFDKHLCECTGIIALNKGDRFTDKKGDVYEVVWNLFNVTDMIMVYHGKLIVGA